MIGGLDQHLCLVFAPLQRAGFECDGPCAVFAHGGAACDIRDGHVNGCARFTVPGQRDAIRKGVTVKEVADTLRAFGHGDRGGCGVDDKARPVKHDLIAVRGHDDLGFIGAVVGEVIAFEHGFECAVVANCCCDFFIADGDHDLGPGLAAASDNDLLYRAVAADRAGCVGLIHERRSDRRAAAIATTAAATDDSCTTDNRRTGCCRGTTTANDAAQQGCRQHRHFVVTRARHDTARHRRHIAAAQIDQIVRGAPFAPLLGRAVLRIKPAAFGLDECDFVQIAI